MSSFFHVEQWNLNDVILISQDGLFNFNIFFSKNMKADNLVKKFEKSSLYGNKWGYEKNIFTEICTYHFSLSIH